MSRTADLKAILLGGFGASALIGNAPRGKFMTEEEVIENIKGKQNTKRVEPTKEDHEGMSLVMAALGGISLSQPTSPVVRLSLISSPLLRTYTTQNTGPSTSKQCSDCPRQQHYQHQPQQSAAAQLRSIDRSQHVPPSYATPNSSIEHATSIPPSHA